MKAFMVLEPEDELVVMGQIVSMKNIEKGAVGFCMIYESKEAANKAYGRKVETVEIEIIKK